LSLQYTYYDFAYVENNPVKAKMVENATDYKYSSAMCHAGLVNNSLVTDYDIGVCISYAKALKLFASPLLWLVVKSNEYDYSLGNKPILPLCV
jgi:hypothetical protein